MFDNAPDESRIKIGRIAFLVLSALPIAIAIHLIVDHPVNKADGLGNMILGFIMMFLSLLLGLIGTIVVIRKAIRRESILFWLCSTTVVALPGLYMGAIYLWVVLSVR